MEDAERLAKELLEVIPTNSDLTQAGADPEAVIKIFQKTLLPFFREHSLNPTLFDERLSAVLPAICLAEQKEKLDGDVSATRPCVELAQYALGFLRLQGQTEGVSRFSSLLGNTDAFCEWFTGATSQMTVCASVSCGNVSSEKPFMRCSRCFAAHSQRIHYCSAFCQAADWSRHKKICGKNPKQLADALRVGIGGTSLHLSDVGPG